MILQPATRGAHTMARVGLPFKPSLFGLLVPDASRREWGLSGQQLEMGRRQKVKNSPRYISCSHRLDGICIPCADIASLKEIYERISFKFVCADPLSRGLGAFGPGFHPIYLLVHIL